MASEMSAIPWEKISTFALAVLPGGAALGVYQAAHPDFLHAVMSFPDLGYKTKLAVVVLCTLVAGFVIRTLVIDFFYNRFVLPITRLKRLESQEWRDPKFRAVFRDKFPELAPQEIPLISNEEFERRKLNANSMDEVEARKAAIRANLEAYDEALEVDSQWRAWFKHYSPPSARRVEMLDYRYQIREGLTSNIFAASIYLAVGSIFVPSLRTWWVALFSLGGVYGFLSAQRYRQLAMIGPSALTQVLEKLTQKAD